MRVDAVGACKLGPELVGRTGLNADDSLAGGPRRSSFSVSLISRVAAVYLRHAGFDA